MQDNNGGVKGVAEITDMNSEYNALTFIIKQIVGRNNTAAMCTVVGVTGGGVTQACYVTLQPLINQIDGNGNAIPCGLLHNVPCYRMQNGANAIISDPQLGDVGVALFSDRDMSALKASYNSGNLSALVNGGVNPQGVNPNTRRRFSVSDGMFFGGFYNGTPTQYIQLLNGKIIINTPTEVDINAYTGDPVTTGTGVVNINSPIINLSSWTGMVAAFATPTLPQGWIYCPASPATLSIAAYPNLYRALQTAWGGNGVTTFGIPYVPANLAILGNIGLTALVTGAVINHLHTQTGNTLGVSGSGTVAGTPGGYLLVAGNTTNPINNNNANNNYAAGIGMSFAVKY